MSTTHELASLETALSWKRARVIKAKTAPGNKRKKSFLVYLLNL